MAAEHKNPNRRQDRADLLRLLHGELPAAPAERLRGRLAREPELAAMLRQMEVTWELLDLPPAPPAPPGFAQRVAARAAAAGRAGAADAAPFRPAWARAMAAAALSAGIIAGAAVGWLVIPPATGPGSGTATTTTAVASQPAGASATDTTDATSDSASDAFGELSAESVPSLAESYWSAFAPEEQTGEGGRIGDGGASGEVRQ